MNCRGENTRRDIVKKYDLKPISHTRLLAGQSKDSCAGPLLTDSYYCFSYQSKLNASDKGTFICGCDAGRDFLGLIGHPGVPRFDPLLDEGHEGNGGGGIGGQHNGAVIQAWDPAAKQLWDAINLIIVCWSNPPQGPLLEIKTKLETARGQPPKTSLVKAINTIIGNSFKTRTLSQALITLRQQEPRLRRYQFDRLNQILASQSVASNYS